MRNRQNRETERQTDRQSDKQIREIEGERKSESAKKRDRQMVGNTDWLCIRQTNAFLKAEKLFAKKTFSFILFSIFCKKIKVLKKMNVKFAKARKKIFAL